MRCVGIGIEQQVASVGIGNMRYYLYVVKVLEYL